MVLLALYLYLSRNKCTENPLSEPFSLSVVFLLTSLDALSTIDLSVGFEIVLRFRVLVAVQELFPNFYRIFNSNPEGLAATTQVR